MSPGDREPCPQCGALNYIADDICVSCGYDLPPPGKVEAEAPALPRPPQVSATAMSVAGVVQGFETGPYVKHAGLLLALFMASSVALAHGFDRLSDGMLGEWLALIYMPILIVGLVVVFLPAAKAGIGGHRGRGWPLRFRQPVAWHGGAHELTAVSPLGASVVGVWAGASVGLLASLIVAPLAIISLFFHTWEGPGLGALFVGPVLGGAVWLGLEGLVLSLGYDLLARAWGGVRFRSEDRGCLPDGLAALAARPTVRAVVVFEAKDIDLPEVSLVDLAGFSLGCLGSCCLPVVLLPVLWVPWVVLNLGAALIGGLEIEVRPA